jgi:hypothetical protein
VLPELAKAMIAAAGLVQVSPEPELVLNTSALAVSLPADLPRVLLLSIKFPVLPFPRRHTDSPAVR